MTPIGISNEKTGFKTLFANGSIALKKLLIKVQGVGFEPTNLYRIGS